MSFYLFEDNPNIILWARLLKMKVNREEKETQCVFFQLTPQLFTICIPVVSFSLERAKPLLTFN